MADPERITLPAEAEVVFISPEKLVRERRQEAVHEIQNDPEALIARLNEIDAEATGEYREVKEYEVVEGVQRPVYGETLVFVSDDLESGAGHFEAYRVGLHGKPYHPAPERRGLVGQTIEKE